MTFIKRFSQNHTLMFTIITAGVFVFIFGFGFIVYPILPMLPEVFYYLPAYDYLLSAFNNFIAFICLVVLVRATGIYKNIPWNVDGIYKGILLGFIFIIFSLIQLFLMYSNTIDKSIAVNWLGVIFGLIYCVSIALWEELLCRGLILTSILKKWYDKPKGVFKAIVVSSLIFGCAHIITMFNSNLVTSLIQVFYATIMGMLIGVIYIKTNSLYAAIVLHFILNLVAYITPYVFPFLGGMNDYQFIQLIVLFAFIWIFLTYMIVQRVTSDDLEYFIR